MKSIKIELLDNLIYYYVKIKSKLLFWSLRFGHFCHFSPKLKHFVSGSLWFQFYCHFGPKVKSDHIYLIKSYYFFLFLRGKMIISFLFYLKLSLKILFM
ncbi:hypothetical protein Hanom_Chr02g00171511 [Helianthus anomalus]